MRLSVNVEKTMKHIPEFRKKLILFGTGDLARIAYEYFTRDTDYEVVAFTIDRDHLHEPMFLGLPLIPFEDLEEIYSTKEHEIHICVVYGDMNRIRQKKCAEAKDKGYKLASYISPHSYISCGLEHAKGASLGEHHFIFENNVIQSGTILGDNCILWSGNHIGHDSKLGSNNFISSHVVVSGWCEIGDNCFIGVNTSIANGSTIGGNSWIAHGSNISGLIPPNSLVKSVASEVVPLNEKALNRALSRMKR